MVQPMIYLSKIFFANTSKLLAIRKKYSVLLQILGKRLILCGDKVYKSGKCVRFVKNMYKGIKSKVQIRQHVSKLFLCKVGVRQGENISFLFSLFINYLESFLLSNGVKQLWKQLVLNVLITHDYFFSMPKQCALFYTDDTVLISESATNLQNHFVFSEYFELWKLNVNITKTKILVFSK